MTDTTKVLHTAGARWGSISDFLESRRGKHMPTGPIPLNVDVFLSGIVPPEVPPTEVSLKHVGNRARKKTLELVLQLKQMGPVGDDIKRDSTVPPIMAEALIAYNCKHAEHQAQPYTANGREYRKCNGCGSLLDNN